MLHADRAEIVEQDDVEVDVGWQQDRYFREGTPPVLKGQRFTLAVPFSGDPDLFQYGTYMGSGAYGEVKHDAGELHLYFQIENDRLTQDVVDNALKGQLKQVQGILANVRPTVDQYNQELPRLVREHIARVRARAEKGRSVASSLSFHLRRKDSPAFPVPVVRKPLAVTRPTPATNTKPEPRLELQAYDEILTMLSNMSRSMERTPAAFAPLGEEFIRDLFLVVLNANFGGAASGETFSVSGKTDIFVPHLEGKVFIAECKFWKGPEGLLATIDQLLGYLSWQDTKAAIILFNRAKSFSAILAKIPESVAAHPNHVRQEAYGKENGFRFVFRQKDDAGREMLLTILAFNVPALEGAAKVSQAEREAPADARKEGLASGPAQAKRGARRP